MEMKILGNRCEAIGDQLGFHICLAIDGQGLGGGGGGLCLMWRESISVEIIGSAANYIDCLVQTDEVESKWRSTGFYGYPDRTRRRESWALLRHLSLLSDKPWLLMGDFNDIVSDSEWRGRIPQPPWLLRGFREAIQHSGLQNVTFQGYQLTWEQGRAIQHSGLQNVTFER
ncbi:unnamed protein product, partial [Cuscuta epithymum]